MTQSTNTVIVCPFCNRRHEMMRAVDEDTTPRIGDYNVCIDCRRISIFDKPTGAGWLVRKPTLAESVNPYLVEIELLAAGAQR